MPTFRMEDELEHPLHLVPCIFSGRKKPHQFTSPSSKVPQPAAIRVQCRFVEWRHHEITGLECPHFTSCFVYEAQFGYLIKAFVLLAQLPTLLNEEASQLSELTKEEFQKHAKWNALKTRIDMVVAVICMFVC